MQPDVDDTLLEQAASSRQQKQEPGAAEATASGAYEEEPDPAVLLLAAEITCMLRTPPLPPRATLERIRALLLEDLHPTKAAAPAATSRQESIRALQMRMERPAISIGSRLAVPPPPLVDNAPTMAEFAALTAKRGGFAVEVDTKRDFRF